MAKAKKADSKETKGNAQESCKTDDKEKVGHPRTWTSEKRREAFLEARHKVPEDYRILDSNFKEELIPYNHLTLDSVLALGGIARHGRVIQIHGDEGAGKTTTALCVTAQYQKTTGEPVGIFEFEPTASVKYAYALGIDPKYCFFEQPTDLQKAIARCIQLMVDFGVRFFLYDSIPFMETKVARKDIESGKAFKSNYGSHAKGISQFYKLLRPWLMEYDAAMLVVNQTRDRIDDDAENASRYSYTNRIYTLPGGRMARFAPSVMIELSLESEVRPWEWGSKMPEEKEKYLLIQPRGDTARNFPTANRVRARSLKNKVTGKGFREGILYIRPNYGLDEMMSIRELACTYNLIGYERPKWIVGKPESPITSYLSKAEMIEDLVLKQNPEVLGKLKGMVLDCIKGDDSERFNAHISTEDRAGVNKAAEGELRNIEEEFDDEEDFEPAASPTKTLNISDIEA